ncbi:hypothetical protein, partial [Amycolatopsis orientalis]|uniref:hypothetical protein n=1 Tax=Amycolatopsis orientalis TaxID=31958 RepID=UPI001F25BC4B
MPEETDKIGGFAGEFTRSGERCPETGRNTQARGLLQGWEDGWKAREIQADRGMPGREQLRGAKTRGWRCSIGVAGPCWAGLGWAGLGWDGLG